MELINVKYLSTDSTDMNDPVNDIRVQLGVDEIPNRWYNILSDLPEQLPPPLNGKTREPSTPEELGLIFPKGLLEQEVSDQRYIDIPDEVQDALVMLNRPSPLQRAVHLERRLNTPAKI